jgi:hypothetical protein
VSRLPLVLLACLACAAVAAASAGAGGPVAQAAKACSVSHAPGKYGTTYLFSLHVSRLSCTGGKRLVKAFNRCRHRHGKAGHCAHTLGYRCREHRFAKISTEYDSNTRCAKGRKVAAFHYEQYT